SFIDISVQSEKTPIGITITGMDKLDKYGISVSLSESQPSIPSPPQGDAFATASMVPAPAEMASDSDAYPEAYDDFDALSESDGLDDVHDMEFDDTALNPLIEIGESDDENAWPVESADAAPAPANINHVPELFAPIPVEPMSRTRIQDFLSSDDFSADTIRPGRMQSPEDGGDSELEAKTASNSGEIRIVFQTLSLMMPHDGFGEKVYFEDVLLTAHDSIPKSVTEAISNPGKRADFQIRIDGKDSGRMCAAVSQGSNDSPPSAYVLEQLFLMYTGMPVQIIRDKEAPLTLRTLKCITRLASATSSMRGVLGFDEQLITQLLRYKNGPPIPDDERWSYEDVAFDDRTSRVSLVVAGENDRHRVTVPVEARVSQLPAKITGPISEQINSIVVEAFESMDELYNADNHDEACSFALALARRLIKCEAAICTLLAPEQDELYISAIDGAIPETRLGARLSLSDGLIGFCMRSGKVARSDQPKEIKASLLRETGLAVDNIMCAPVIANNRPLGAIELMNSVDAAGFTRETADLLAYIANSLGDFIEASGI
ncbi:MAG: GAF domain-containing protein, partial [Deltaproteobacteria bacterium]|nr:GAF domain-containing protein [Deltaproteobacteria bacterium]